MYRRASSVAAEARTSAEAAIVPSAVEFDRSEPVARLAVGAFPL